jgi:uncharacterized protein (DUF362 family)/NAD-dependent dihydropyrimidine dehydrogenase PreA subunit
MSRPRVHLVPADRADLADAARRALDCAGLDVRGCTVLLKPNMVGPHPEHLHSVTAPPLLRALAEELRNRGAEVRIGDNPGFTGYSAVRRSAVGSGILPLCEEFFVNLGEESRLVEVDPAWFGGIERIPISSQVLDCDLLISVPRMKTHVQTIITGAIKNSYGHMPGSIKAQLHARVPDWRAFSRLTAAVYAARPPDLVIMDALTAMEGNGPTAGALRKLDLLLVSTDGAALDAVMCAMMGLDPEEVPMTAAAGELGVGAVRPQDIDVSETVPRIPRFRVPRRWTLSSASIVNRLLFPLLNPQPRIRPADCVSCNACVRICPVAAIAEESPPVIDPRACIQCYCCLEICPEKAIDFGGSRLKRWLRSLGERRGDH